MQFLFYRKYLYSLCLFYVEFLSPLEIHALCFSFLALFVFKGNDLLYICEIVFKIQYNLFGDLYMHKHLSNMLPLWCF